METDIGETSILNSVPKTDDYRQLCKSHIEYILLQPKPQNFNAGKYVKRGYVPCRRGCGLFFYITRVEEVESDHKKQNKTGNFIVDSRHGKVLDDDDYSEYIIHSQHCDVKYQLMEFSRSLRKPEHKNKMRDDINGCKPESVVCQEKEQLGEKVKTMSISNRPKLSFDDYKEQIENKKCPKTSEDCWGTSKISFGVVNTRETKKLLSKLPLEGSVQRVKKWLDKYIDDMTKQILDTPDMDA